MRLYCMPKVLLRFLVFPKPQISNAQLYDFRGTRIISMTLLKKYES